MTRGARQTMQILIQYLRLWQRVCLSCKLCLRGEALTGGQRVWTLTQSRIMYDWGSTQEPALAFNVGKPAAPTWSSELQRRPLAVFQETQDVVKQKWRNTHAAKKHPLVPISTLLAFFIFLVICSQHTLGRKDFLFCLLLSLRLCLRGRSAAKFRPKITTALAKQPSFSNKIHWELKIYNGNTAKRRASELKKVYTPVQLEVLKSEVQTIINVPGCSRNNKTCTSIRCSWLILELPREKVCSK